MRKAYLFSGWVLFGLSAFLRTPVPN